MNLKSKEISCISCFSPFCLLPFKNDQEMPHLGRAGGMGIIIYYNDPKPCNLLGAFWANRVEVDVNFELACNIKNTSQENNWRSVEGDSKSSAVVDCVVLLLALEC